MVNFDITDRDKKAKKGFKTIYALLCNYNGIDVLKIGHTSNASVRGRLAWNTYANECYHIHGFRGGIYEDEKDRVKITDVVQVKEIIDEVQIQGNFSYIIKYENALRSLFKPYTFKENFSGKTEYVVVEEDTIEKIKLYFNDFRNKLICS